MRIRHRGSCVFFACLREDVKWGYYDSERLMTLSRGKASLASVTSIIPQQTCLSLCQEHSDACDAAFSRVQPLRADGTAKSNTSQQCPFTAVPCYQVCASFRRVHFVIFCGTRAHVQKPDSPLSHLKPHKHAIHPPPPPPRSGPFLPRLPDAERDSGAEWGGTRALVSPVKAKDLVRPSIPPPVPRLIHTLPLNIARARHGLLLVIYWCYYQVINCSILYKYEQNCHFSF